MNYVIWIFAGLFVFLSSEHVAAQSKPAADTATKTQNIHTAETGWQVICRATSTDRTKLGCSVLHETFSTQERVRLTSVEVVRVEKNRSLLVSVPLGVSLKEGIEFGIDGQKVSTLLFSHCINTSCFASFDLNDTQINTLKKGKIMDLTFQDIQGNKIKTDIPLGGFAQALAKAE